MNHFDITPIATQELTSGQALCDKSVNILESIINCPQGGILLSCILIIIFVIVVISIILLYLRRKR